MTDSDIEQVLDQAVDALEMLANSYSAPKHLGRLVERMAHRHKTAVQAFTGGFVVPFVRELARQHREGECDLRNADAGLACSIMCDAVETEYGVKDGEPIRFAVV